MSGDLRQIVVCGNTAFITAREDGLFIVDVSDPARPEIIARYDTIEFATGIDVEDGFAFIACRWFGVEIVDISDARNPKHISVMRVGEAQSCEVSDGYLYAGAWAQRRVVICDVRNPAAPKKVAAVQLDGRGDGVCVRNGILYAAMGHHQPGASLGDDPGYGAGNGMEIYDVSDPAQPKRLSRVRFDWRYYYGYPDTWRVKLSFPYAYLYHTHNGVFVFDVSDPKSPKELAQIRITHYRTQGQVYAAVENGDWIYAACGSAGIHVLDKNLQLKKVYPTRGFAMDVQVGGREAVCGGKRRRLGLLRR